MKKGAYILSIEIVQSIPKLIMITLTVIVIMASVYFYVNRDIDVRDIESHVLASRLYYSRNCALYFDGVRYYPGIIDLDKFNDDSLSRCYSTNEKIAMKFTLKDVNSKVINEVKVNKFPLELCSVKDKNFLCYFNRQYVLYMDKGTKKEGVLDTNIIIKDE